MEVPIKEEWENYLPKPYVYYISPKDHKYINYIFRPLYKAGKISPVTGYIPLVYLVFIV
jgi:hypothetical protein